MLNRKIIVSSLVFALLAMSAVVYSQMIRPYRNGSVWNIGYIRIKPGMDNAYMTYLATDWKRQQEALKKEGLTLSYKVITTEAHGTSDFNVMLLTEFKDLASMEANQPRVEAVNLQLSGSDSAVIQGYKDRSEIRDVLQNRLAREIILEPRR